MILDVFIMRDIWGLTALSPKKEAYNTKGLPQLSSAQAESTYTHTLLPNLPASCLAFTGIFARVLGTHKGRDFLAKTPTDAGDQLAEAERTDGELEIRALSPRK